MSSFLSVLKDQVSMLNGFVYLFLLACIFLKFGKRKLAVSLIVFDLFIFLISSTDYLPKYLARKLERQYPTFDIKNIKNTSGNIYNCCNFIIKHSSIFCVRNLVYMRYVNRIPINDATGYCWMVIFYKSPYLTINCNIADFCLAKNHYTEGYNL